MSDIPPPPKVCSDIMVNVSEGREEKKVGGRGVRTYMYICMYKHLSGQPSQAMLDLTSTHCHGHWGYVDTGVGEWAASTGYMHSTWCACVVHVLKCHADCTHVRAYVKTLSALSFTTHSLSLF